MRAPMKPEADEGVKSSLSQLMKDTKCPSERSKELFPALTFH